MLDVDAVSTFIRSLRYEYHTGAHRYLVLYHVQCTGYEYRCEYEYRYSTVQYLLVLQYDTGTVDRNETTLLFATTLQYELQTKTNKLKQETTTKL